VLTSLRRPLPEEMFNYARSDTHFLLYIFDCIRNELLEKSNLSDPENKMASVLRNSEEVSLRLYEREHYDVAGGDGAMGWRNLLGRSQEGLNPMQVSVFKAVHHWRDTIARTEDESVNYVMPRHSLFNLARKMPSDVAGVLACCPRPSPPVKTRAGELVVVIRNAKDTPEVRAWKAAQEEEIKAAEGAAALEEATTPAVVEEASTAVFAAPEEQIRVLRAASSKFWGACDDSSRWTTVALQEEGLHLAVPLPQLTAEVFAAAPTPSYETTPVVEEEKKEVGPGARAEHEYVKNRPKKEEESDVIVVRALGGGRKRKHEASSEEAADSESVVEKKDKKRKKEKKEKKEKDVAADDEESVQPFDYASAPSVLNQKRAAAEAGGKKEKKKKPFNPYAGSANAPKGLSRSNQERAGRTATFKG
jgi:exosome complex exonuclease RRP6